MDGKKYLSSIYCINLDTEKRRWKEVKEEFKKIDILGEVTRFKAISIPENGHLGCMLSHKEIIKRAKREKHKRILVFEDDIYIEKPADFYKQIKLIEKEQYDICYLGGIFRHPKCNLKDFNEKFFRVEYLYGGHAIIYNESIYDIFLQLCDLYEIAITKRETSFDAFLAKVIQTCRVCILPKKFLIGQKIGYSSTEKLYKGKVLSFLNKCGYLLTYYKFGIIHFYLFTIINESTKILLKFKK